MARTPTLPEPDLFTGHAAPTAGSTARTFGEFFAGVGLARIGLERSGWAIRFANDLDPAKLRMYEGHFGCAPYYRLQDVHELAGAPDLTPDFTLAHASFPCTDLSLAGGRKGIHAGQSSAFWGFCRWLDAKGDRRPPLVLLENVTGFLTSHGGADFHEAIRALCDMGYAVDALVVDAAHFVPQSRPRLFVVAKAMDDPQATLTPEALSVQAAQAAPTARPASLVRAMQAMDATQGVRWSIRPLPALPPYGQSTIDQVLDDLPEDDPAWWSAERADYLLSQMSDRHRRVADAMIAGDAWRSGAVFRRVRQGRSMAELRTDGLAGCLRTPKGGSGRQILFQGGFGRHRVRLFTANECARLMGAAGYRITVGLNQALFGFGDAVCADAIDWIARHYLNPLADSLEG